MEQIFLLLKKKDDTSRFVALSLLRTWLDTHPESQRDELLLVTCWDNIPTPFLLRLLKSRPTDKINETDAKNMCHLAIAIIHTFSNLLTDTQLEASNFEIFVCPLAEAIGFVDPAQRSLIFHSLQCILTTESGRILFLKSLDPFIGLLNYVVKSAQDPVPLITLIRVIAIDNELVSETEASFDQMLVKLLQADLPNRHLVFQLLVELLNSHDIREDSKIVAWVPQAISVLHTQLVQSLSKPVRDAFVVFAGTLIRRPPSSWDVPKLLYTKENSLLFVKLLLVDIRSTIPALLSSLNEPTYAATSLRLAYSYDLITAFLSVLLKSVESENPDVEIPPESLLKLRGDLTETFSLTLEYFRDRWDAAFAGSAGLHEMARAPTSKFSSTPLPLTWDNPNLSPAHDPVILSGLQAVAFWLSEDENESLKDQILGLNDMLLELYNLTATSFDLRPTILTIFHALFSSSNTAVQDFLDQDGWRILAVDFTGTIQQYQIPFRIQDIIRVMIDIVESAAVHQSREAWMKLITLIESQMLPNTDTKPSSVDTERIRNILAAYQLAIALFEKAPQRLQKSHLSELRKIHSYASSILDSKFIAQVSIFQDAQDVIEGIDSLLI
jgi:hypothetical protein